MIRCDTCRRHYFKADTRCPFCAKAPPKRLRSGLIAAGLTVLAGCPAYGMPPDRDDAQVDASHVADAARDADVADAALDGAMAMDAAPDVPILPPYGIPPDARRPDAAQDASVDAEPDMPIAQPPYGIPPEPDLGVAVDATVDQGDAPDMPIAQPPYGIPPEEG